MTCLPRPVMKTNCSMPASRASSTAYWMTGLSTTGSISLGMALVAGRKRVPIPATGKTALRTGLDADMIFPGDVFVRPLFHGMGPPLLSSFKDLADLDGQICLARCNCRHDDGAKRLVCARGVGADCRDTGRAGQG